MARNSRDWAAGTMRDGIRKIHNARESKAAGRDVFAFKVPYRDGNGTQTSETFTTVTKAEKFRDLVRSQKHAGLLEDFKAGAVSVATWAATWSDTMEATTRDTTWASYEGLLRLYVLPALGGLAVRAVTPMDVQRAVNAWCKNRSPRSVHLTYKVCVGLFKAAVASGLRRTSPCVDISLPELPDTEVVPFTVAEITALVDAIHPHFRLLLTMALQTGLRIGELRGLTWDRIDLKARTVTVNRQLRAGVLRPVKSKASKRVVPLSDALVVELAADKMANPPKAFTIDVKGTQPTTTHLVFTSLRGRPLGDAAIAPSWKKACAAVGIPAEQARFHNLRHTFASLLIDRGRNVAQISSWMGHANVAVTLNVYTHLMPGSDDSLRSVMDDVFGPDPAPIGPDGDTS